MSYFVIIYGTKSDHYFQKVKAFLVKIDSSVKWDVLSTTKKKPDFGVECGQFH